MRALFIYKDGESYPRKHTSLHNGLKGGIGKCPSYPTKITERNC